MESMKENARIPKENLEKFVTSELTELVFNMRKNRHARMDKTHTSANHPLTSGPITSYRILDPAKRKTGSPASQRSFETPPFSSGYPIFDACPMSKCPTSNFLKILETRNKSTLWTY
jgi:hypothetical protein